MQDRCLAPYNPQAYAPIEGLVMQQAAALFHDWGKIPSIQLMLLH